MHRLKLIGLRAGIGVLRFVYAFMKLAPVQKKYLFMTKLSTQPPLDFTVLAAALEKAHPDYRVVMLCQPIAGKPQYVRHMFTQMHQMATSEVVFLDRSCLVVHVLHHRDTLQVIQLWHAIGSMKKFGYAILDTDEGQAADLARVCHMHEGYTHILISSKTYLDDYKQGFNVDGSTVVEIPPPRVDLLIDPLCKQRKRDEIFAETPALATKKNILYCPTFRGKETQADQRAVEALVDAIDFNEYNFIFKPHPLSKTTLDDERIIRTKRSTLDMLFVADAVITDYSSIMYEAGLLRLPIYLYAYDWNDYRKHRAHNIDIEHDVPALFSADPTVIISAIEAGGFDFAAFDAFVQKNVHLPKSGSCCDAIIRLVDAEKEKGRK